MLHSRFVPALLCAALVHAALIALFVTTPQAPPMRQVETATIAAQLLPAEPDAAHRTYAAARSMTETAQPQLPHTRADTTAPDMHAGKQPARKSRSQSPAAAPASPATPRTIAAPAGQPSQPSNAFSNPPSPAAQTVAAGVNAPSSATSAVRAPTALTAPKRVEHADCRIVKPSYPELSKRRSETGTANVRFVIGTSGAVESVALAKSSGFTRLDDAAIEAVRESICQPYLENGSAIRASVAQAFTFGLDDD